jgi:hypothetical protein
MTTTEASFSLAHCVCIEGYYNRLAHLGSLLSYTEAVEDMCQECDSQVLLID